MRIAMARALGGTQSLGDSEMCERPVNRVAAMGAAQVTDEQRRRALREWEGKNAGQAEIGAAGSRGAAYAALGADLIRFKYANMATAKQDAEDQLSAALAWKKWNLALEPRECDRVARQALMEWAIDFCPTCRGAVAIPASMAPQDGRQPMRDCPDCHGTGKRRYTDSERPGRAYEAAMSRAHEIIARAEEAALRGAMRLLERW